MDPDKPRRQSWEYRTEEYAAENETSLGMWLSSRGREGWELVTMIHHVSGPHLYTAVFKRPGLTPPAKPGKPKPKGGKR